METGYRIRRNIYVYDDGCKAEYTVRVSHYKNTQAVKIYMEEVATKVSIHPNHYPGQTPFLGLG